MQNYKYRQGSIVTLRSADDMPVFGEVLEVLVFDTSKALFLVRELETVKLYHHYHAFEVISPNKDIVSCIRQSELGDPVPLTLLNACDARIWDKQLVVPRYNMFT